MSVTKILCADLCFGEGPRWRDGRLFFSDMQDHRILTLDDTGRLEEVAPAPHQPSGLGWTPAGDLVFVSMLDRRVMRLRGGVAQVYADLSGFTPHPCNDMIVSATGHAYVGGFGFDLVGGAAPAQTRLIHIPPEGAPRAVGDPLMFPNGAVITPDGGALIVAETFAGRLRAFDILPDGGLGASRVWAAVEDFRPDGITLDKDGAIWAASPGRRAVLRIAEGGEILDRIPLEQDAYACVLGGADMRDLFILTAPTFQPEQARKARAGRVEVARVATPGVGSP